MQSEVNDIIAELDLYQQELCQRLGNVCKQREEQVQNMLSSFLICGDQKHLNIEAVVALRTNGLVVRHARSQLKDTLGRDHFGVYGVVMHGNTSFMFASGAVN